MLAMLLAVVMFATAALLGATVLVAAVFGVHFNRTAIQLYASTGAALLLFSLVCYLLSRPN